MIPISSLKILWKSQQKTQRHPALPARLLSSLAAVFLTLLPPSSAARAETPAGKPLEVVISGLKAAQGSVRVALFTDPKEFPKGTKAAFAAIFRATEKETRGSFPSVPAGRYAVAVFHDENENGKLDTNFLGIPSEPYGFGNDAKAKMGPPSFEDAAVDVGPATTELRIHLK